MDRWREHEEPGESRGSRPVVQAWGADFPGLLDDKITTGARLVKICSANPDNATCRVILEIF